MSIKQWIPKRYRAILSQLTRPPYRLRWMQLAKNIGADTYYTVQGRYKNNLVYAYWSNNRPNFGDFITPALLLHYGFSPVQAYPPQAAVVSTGSIAQNVPSDYQGIILGSGLIQPESGFRFPHANILAVRGQLTRQLIHAPKNTALGDPGLLVSRLYPPAATKKYLLGLVPHYTDIDDPRLHTLLARHRGEMNLINVQQSPQAVCHAITQCQYILSSSLHGLVVADSYGIPNAWMKLSDKVTGGNFKFQDYYSAFDVDYLPVQISGQESSGELIQHMQIPSAAVDDRREKLDELFASLPALLR